MTVQPELEQTPAAPGRAACGRPEPATMMTWWRRARRLAAAAGWLTLVAALALVLVSVALSPESNWTVRAAVAAFCVLAIARPDAALLVLIALVGFGIILSHLAGVPDLRVTEVLVVGSLAGCIIKALRQTAFRRAVTGSISVPVVLFAIAAAASTIVWLRVYQVQTGYAADYVLTLFRFLSRDYFVQPGEFWVVVSTATLLEGLALYVVVAALCQTDATFFERALRMLAVGGAGLAVMSAVRLAEILLRNPGAIAVLRATPTGLRISPQIPDYIAAGSYFALCWLVALGLAIAWPRRRLVWVAAGVPVILALYLTGSRSVIAAAVVGLIVLLWIIVRQTAAVNRAVVAFAIVAIAAMVMSYSWMTGRDVAGVMARQSVTVRVELARAGVHVVETRPLFGVGIDRFHLVAAGFASPELRALWPARMSPHNDFLRIGAELGLVGLGLFLWILGAAARRTWRALQRSPNTLLAALVGGVAAFLVTSLVSNPLMVRQVSFVFWVALGLAVGQSRAARPAADGVTAGSAPRGRLFRLKWPLAGLIAAALIVSIPFRASQELADAGLTHVSYGFSGTGTDPDGTRWRWSGPRATLYVDARARVVEIPLRGTLPSGASQQVEVRLDGRLANRVTVGPEWQRLRTIVPADRASGPRRLDLLVSPCWVPAEVLPGSSDRRVLGVHVGELDVLTIASDGR